ncbi:MAG: hypothetical protein HXY43_08950 [Fischerella sp.]|uniref:hypothetical protein n=1 Tax=Fischerella sp. TaxID=1191 RepID=UPI0017D97FD0|nr:hypothetical protein [Fischerella sp.]NWF59417.1 hypothetical protein [Fischerella sp.]
MSLTHPCILEEVQRQFCGAGRTACIGRARRPSHKKIILHQISLGSIREPDKKDLYQFNSGNDGRVF